MKNFILIGAAGYIAPKHMRAIRETGNNLVAALDINDSVGVIDNYFPRAEFFTDAARLENYIGKLQKEGQQVDFVSICSPNHLHDEHIRFGFSTGANIICEKPLVLDPLHVDALAVAEQESGKKVYTILQMRLHPSAITLKEKISKGPAGKKYKVDLSYITARGNWYHSSWKGDAEKSGGIATNIGVHFFDLLNWVFGPVQENRVDVLTNTKASGQLQMEKAEVNWVLSINADDLPAETAKAGKHISRSLEVDGEKLDFSDGFGDLHTRSYEAILMNKGFGLDEIRPSIELVHRIRHSKPG